MRVPGPYLAELFGQLSLSQNPRQETFWASAGFESVEKSVTLSDAPRRLALDKKIRLRSIQMNTPYIKHYLFKLVSVWIEHSS